MALSRREVLKLFGMSSLALGVSSLGLPRSARAQQAPPFGSFYRFKVGEFEMTAIQDFWTTLDVDFVAANAPEEAAALLETLNLPQAGASYNVLLINTGDQLVLMDTGNGAGAGGLLLPTLELLGVAPSDINAVVISHFHPDHVNGLAANGESVFPNATIYFPQAEYDFLQGGPYGSEAIDGLIVATNAQLDPAMAAEKIEFYGDGDEVVPGIQAIHTPGHTPGHISHLISSGRESILSSVDVAIQAPLSVAHPEWHMVFDSDPELAVTTRRNLLQRAADERLRIYGYHFPFPGLGYISAQGEGYQFEPFS